VPLRKVKLQTRITNMSIKQTSTCAAFFTGLISSWEWLNVLPELKCRYSTKTVYDFTSAKFKSKEDICFQGLQQSAFRD